MTDEQKERLDAFRHRVRFATPEQKREIDRILSGEARAEREAEAREEALQGAWEEWLNRPGVNDEDAVDAFRAGFEAGRRAGRRGL